MRAPTAPQLARLFTNTPSALHRRVRALHALGLVRVHVLSPNDPNIVTLTPKGAELVGSLGLPREEIHRARFVVHRDRHAELIGDLRVAFTLLTARRPDLELDCFLSDWDLRRALGARSRGAYVPDALVSITHGGETAVLAYEIDRGFEPATVIAGKAASTVALARAGTPLYGFAPPWRPVLLASSERRLALLSRHVVAAGGGALWACGLLDARHEPDAPRFALAHVLAGTDVSSDQLVSRLLPAPA